MDAPEYTSVEDFVQFLCDDERDSFTFEEATGLAEALGQATPVYVIRQLKEYGLSMEPRQSEKQVRGFRANSHDRWYGVGSCPTFGGSGWEQISGFAGRNG